MVLDAPRFVEVSPRWGPPSQVCIKPPLFYLLIPQLIPNNAGQLRTAVVRGVENKRGDYRWEVRKLPGGRGLPSVAMAVIPFKAG